MTCRKNNPFLRHCFQTKVFADPHDFFVDKFSKHSLIFIIFKEKIYVNIFI